MNTEGQPLARALAQRVLKWLLLPLIPLGNSFQRKDTPHMVDLAPVVETISTDRDGSQDKNLVDRLTGTDFITSICSNLVIFDYETQTFRFAHLSVVEYLQQKVLQDTNPPEKEFSYAHVSAEVATSCLSWILYSAKHSQSGDSRSPSPLRPSITRSYTSSVVPTLATIHLSLFHFSVIYWPFYYTYAISNGGEEQELQDAFRKVMLETRRGNAFSFWIDQYKQFSGVTMPRLQGDILMPPSSDYSRPVQSWHEAPSTTQVSGSRFIARYPVSPGTLYSASGSPSRIFAAATFGFASVITAATDAELAERNVFKQTNLQIAAVRGHLDVVKALLERQCVREDINAHSWNDGVWDAMGTDRYSRAQGTALHFAELCRRDNTEVIEELVEAGADTEAKNSLGQTPKESRDMLVSATTRNN